MTKQISNPQIPQVCCLFKVIPLYACRQIEGSLLEGPIPLGLSKLTNLSDLYDGKYLKFS